MLCLCVFLYERNRYRCSQVGLLLINVLNLLTHSETVPSEEGEDKGDSADSDSDDSDYELSE